MESGTPSQKDDTSPLDVSDLGGLLHEVEQTPHAQVQGETPDPRLVVLRDYQVRRLAYTYRDLLNSTRYQAACNFFIRDVYAARDFSQRNYDLRHFHDTLRRWIPEAMIHSFSLAVQLHELTQALDLRLLQVLVGELGLQEKLTVSMYAEAYRRCDNYAERVRQIEMIEQIGTGVETLVNIPFSENVLRLGHGPATRAGWGDLISFLERGYAAFKQMHGAKDFLKTIRTRERDILDRIYAKDADPFGLRPSANV